MLSSFVIVISSMQKRDLSFVLLVIFVTLVQDCVVSGWGSWSTCDQECGQGTMTRTRLVLRDARNGGKACPSLVQKRGCRGTKCRHHKNKITLEGELNKSNLISDSFTRVY